jgi:DNA-binding NtrC family response regulator
MERAVTLASSAVIELDDLPEGVRRDYATALAPSIGRDDTLRAWASRYARLMLEKCRGNKREASQALGISYHTLQAYLRHPPHEPQPRVVPGGTSQPVEAMGPLSDEPDEPALVAALSV